MTYIGKVTAVNPRGYTVFCVGRISGLLPATEVPEPLKKDDFLRVSTNTKQSGFGRTIFQYEGRATQEVYEQAVRRVMGEKDLENRIKVNNHSRMSSI